MLTLVYGYQSHKIKNLRGRNVYKSQADPVN